MSSSKNCLSLQILFRFDNVKHAVIEMMELMSCVAKGHWELIKTGFSTAANFEKKKLQIDFAAVAVLHSHYTNVVGSK